MPNKVYEKSDSMPSRGAFPGLTTVLLIAALGTFLDPWYKARFAIMRFRTGFSLGGIFGPRNKGEKWAISLGWWIPRRYRGDIIGDILEDCSEMRDKGCGEWRIRIQVIWQWAIAVVNLIPAAVVGSVWRRLNPPK